MFEFTVPATYHLTDPRPCEKPGCDHNGWLSCSDDRYVDVEMVNWLKERTEGYYFLIPHQKSWQKTPKPFRVFITDFATAVSFKLMYGFPYVVHQ